MENLSPPRCRANIEKSERKEGARSTTGAGTLFPVCLTKQDFAATRTNPAIFWPRGTN